MTSTVTATQGETAWEGFAAGRWQEAIDVRDFIQRNYSPYEGDASFLAGPTERVRVKALPDHLPQSIEYSIESLVDFDATIHVRDLTIPEDVTPLQRTISAGRLSWAPFQTERASS